MKDLRRQNQIINQPPLKSSFFSLSGEGLDFFMSSQARGENNYKICIQCKKIFKRKKHFSNKKWNKQKFCSLKCWNKYRILDGRMPFGNKHWSWKGGKYKRVDGYIVIYKPEHPYTTSHRTVLEHRLVMEKYLGRYLKPEEVVHHINRILDDNKIENLQLFANIGEHCKFHRQQKKKQIEYYI